MFLSGMTRHSSNMRIAIILLSTFLLTSVLFDYFQHKGNKKQKIAN